MVPTRAASFLRGHLAEMRTFLPSPSIEIGANEKSRVNVPLAPLTLIFLPSRFNVYIFWNLNSFRYFWKPHKVHLFNTRRLRAFLQGSFLQHLCELLRLWKLKQPLCLHLWMVGISFPNLQIRRLLLRSVV